MEILNNTISDIAAKQIEALCCSFRKPVVFIPDDGDEKKEAEYINSIDMDPSQYYAIRLTSGLERRMFEAQVLHEILHIRQFEMGYPALCNKHSQQFLESSDSVEELGSSIFSGVLDIEVFARMTEYRYADAIAWAADNTYYGLITGAAQELSNSDDKYSFANLVITFAKVLYHTTGEQDAAIQKMFDNYPRVLESAFSMRDMLRACPPDTSDSAVVTMGNMIDMLDLWDLFYIRLADNKIRTKAEFEAYNKCHRPV